MSWTGLLQTLSVAFAGGVFGACLGGVTAFALCGVAALVGVAVRVAGGPGVFDSWVTWGPFLGPQAAFCGAVGAAAYAARRGKLDSGRDLLTPLAASGSTTVLLVGGLWGVTGQGLFEALRYAQSGGRNWFDPMAASVALTTVAVRLVAGNSGLLGELGEGESRWSPSPERQWLPWQSRPAQITLLGVAVALPSAWVAQKVPAASGIVFALSAVTLLLFLARLHVPVTLHMALAAEAAATLWGGWWPAIVAAVGCGLLAELFARLWLVHGDTHIDPPACALAVVSVASRVFPAS